MADPAFHIDPDASLIDRQTACAGAEQHIPLLPAASLAQILAATEDLMHEDASLDARRAGFAVLSGLLRHSEASPNLYANAIKDALTNVDSTVTEQQFETLHAALLGPSALSHSAEEVVEYSLHQLLPQFEAQNVARKRARSENRAIRVKDTPAEERGMHRILEFLVDLIRERPDLFPDLHLIRLLRLILTIAERASATGTVERVCLIIRSIVLVLRIPSKVLRRCLEDLCAIYNTTQRLKDVTWECLELLMKSDHQDENEVVDIVLDTIGLPPQERQSHTVCGAIRTARFLITSQGNPHIPPLTFGRFLDALSKVNFGSRRIRREVLRTIGLLLTDDSTGVLAVASDDWGPLLDVVSRAIDERRPGGRSRQSLDIVGSDEHEPSDANEPSPKLVTTEDVLTDQVAHIADAFARLWPQCVSGQRRHIRKFFVKFEAIIPEGFLIQFLLGLLQDGYFAIGVPHRYERFDELVALFGIGEDITRDVRCTVVKIIKSCHLEASTKADHDHFHHLILLLLSDFETHKDLQVANALTETLLVHMKNPNADDSHLQQALERIWPLISASNDSDGQDHFGHASGTLSTGVNSVAVALVELFLHCLPSNPRAAVILFNHLVSISSARHLSSSAQLPAIQLLTRLRCDLRHRVLVIPSPDIQGLATTLCRTHTTVPDRGSILSGRQVMSGLEEKIESKPNRASGTSGKTNSTLRSNARSSTRVEKAVTSKPPLWLYPGGPALPVNPPSRPSAHLRIYSPEASKEVSVHLGDWLASAISILQHPDVEWEIFSYVIVHLPPQLSNRELFTASSPHVRMLRRILVDQLLTGRIYDPPKASGARKGDVALCLYHALVMLVGYSDQAEREEQERIVQAFVDGVTKWERTARFCIQSLTICCLVFPSATTNWLSAILQRMSQMITQSHLSMDILEFLATLARHRKVYVNFREEEYRTVFAICIRYLENSRESRLRLLTPGDRATSVQETQLLSDNEKKSTTHTEVYDDLSQYVFSLAYHVLTVWFLAVRIGDRNDHVGWITSNLAWKDASGSEIMEEQSQVTLDMMMRTAYLNLGETAAPEPFTPSDGRVLSKTWLLGLSIVTIETATATGVSRVTKRQASGTTYAMYRPQTIELPPHHEASPEEERGSDMGINIFPNHVLLQLTSSTAPTPSPMEAICLPEEESVRRAIAVFDRNDTVDGYKVGIVYAGNDQIDEASILANSSGSPAFESFLAGLGTKVKLQGATFNTQGLDRVSDTDGSYTYAWRDRVTEIIFHVPTMMPTDLANDAHCVNKKRHIGNDYVKIIWNESGHPFRFDTFASQFNCVNIIIVPDALLVTRTPDDACEFDDAFGSEKEPYYTVQVITADGFPDLSPVASYKLLPLRSLPMLVRQLALQASVFCNVWMNRETGEHASSWRNRLREIKTLRDRYANTGTSTSEKYPGAKSRTSYQTGDSFQGRVVMGGLAELGEDLVASLDFSRWAGPNANS